jgi:hypothetical protein
MSFLHFKAHEFSIGILFYNFRIDSIEVNNVGNMFFPYTKQQWRSKMYSHGCFLIITND